MLVIPTSTRITTLVPQVSLKGVSPVQVLVVVLYTHKTLGNSSGHAPLASSNLALMILSGVWFVTFVCSFVCGCLGDENQFLIPRLKQKSLKLWLSNYYLLFDTIVRGVPNLQIMFFHTKLWIFALMMVDNASASTHFVKQSIMTNKIFTCLLPQGNRPKMSILHCANGHGEAISVNLFAGRH